MSKKFLDSDGLGHFASRIKDYVVDVVNGYSVGVFNFKGVLSTMTELNAVSSKEIGDVYQVQEATGSPAVANQYYAWNGETWVSLGTSINMDDFSVTNEQLDDELFNN